MSAAQAAIDRQVPALSSPNQPDYVGTGDWTAAFSKRSVGAAGFDGDSSQNQLLELGCLLSGCISTQGVIPPIGQGFLD